MPTKAELEQELATLKAEKPAAPEFPKETSQFPVPKDFLESMHTTLNDRFSVEVDYHSDSPQFDLSILVPEEYSNAGKSHWDMYHEDRRTRVINNADGVGGVKQWVEKVYDNFDNETKARITSDRKTQ